MQHKLEIRFGYPHNYTEQHNQNLYGHTAIVTGTNSGTGYEISLTIVRVGATATMACQNPSKWDTADGVKIYQDIATNDNTIVVNKNKIGEDISFVTGYDVVFWSVFSKVHQSVIWTSEEVALTLLYLGTSSEVQQQNSREK